MEGTIVEKTFKKQFEKYDEDHYDLYFEFNKDQKEFIKFRNQIGLVFTILMNHWSLGNFILWNCHLLEKLLKAHRIQREFNEKSKSDNYCQQTEMNDFRDEQKRMNSKMNKLENKLEEILSFQKKTSEILTQLAADKS